jgi:hypothetical protein
MQFSILFYDHILYTELQLLEMYVHFLHKTLSVISN